MTARQSSNWQISHLQKGSEHSGSDPYVGQAKG